MEVLRKGALVKAYRCQDGPVPALEKWWAGLGFISASFLQFWFNQFKLVKATVEIKVEMVGMHCERRIRKSLSKIRGIEKVEVELSTQKVVVSGYVHRNKVLRALRRSGFKADFWCTQNEFLLNAYASASYGSFRLNRFGFL